MVKLRIRLRSQGSTNNKSFRIVVADSRSKRDGKYIDLVGHYLPRHPREAEQLTVDLVKFEEWISKGAIASEAVHNLVKKIAK